MFLTARWNKEPTNMNNDSEKEEKGQFQEVNIPSAPRGPAAL